MVRARKTRKIDEKLERITFTVLSVDNESETFEYVNCQGKQEHFRAVQLDKHRLDSIVLSRGNPEQATVHRLRPNAIRYT